MLLTSRPRSIPAASHRAVVFCFLAVLVVIQAGCVSRVIVERNVELRLRDGTILRGDVFRPRAPGRYPVLVYRTPYGKDEAATDYRTHIEAVKRNYAVLLQDVRGRHASEGVFVPYRHEGADGYDTIEWAARTAWSNGDVGTYGLSYPGAVQWLAAKEQPPHLKAMVPAMTFSSPRNFFYMNGVFDTSWLPWIYGNIAPNARRRLGLPGIHDESDAWKTWPSVAKEYRSWLPLRDLPWLRQEAPYYFEWLAHPPEEAYWDWAELRGHHVKVQAAVLNLSGWYDEGYGPEGAVTNFNALVADRRARQSGMRTNLLLGPWEHGVGAVGARHTGDVDFGPRAAIDYDDVVLDFFDHHLRGVANGFSRAPPVRYFVMGSNEWRSAPSWPPPEASTRSLYFAQTPGGGKLSETPLRGGSERSEFVADPTTPVTDAYSEYGPHDYQSLRGRHDLLTFDSEPLHADTLVAGAIVAEISVSCDCRDFDLWVRLYDVAPDGRAMSLMSPGNDVLRASYRIPGQRTLLTPGQVYRMRLPNLLTANRFGKGHRIRAQVSASFAPHLSRNLQTGESEATSAQSRPARITIHHGADGESRLLLPVLPR